MRFAKGLVIPVAALALAGCSLNSSTIKSETNSSAPANDCSFDKTVDGVTAVAQVGSDPQLTIAKDAKPPKELQAIDLCPGDGESAAVADTVTVGYVGVGYDSKKVFDSSYQRGVPATFPLSGVIPGWTEGVSGMKPGGARLLLIPSELAYGKNPQPGSPIGKDESLAFIVELDSIGSPSVAPS